MIINDLSWWVAKDVCTAFGIANHKRTVSDLVENYKEIQVDIDEVLSKHPIPDALGGLHDTTILSEEGLYALIFQSRKKEALRFQHWTTFKVLPSIRKTGGYVQS